MTTIKLPLSSSFSQEQLNELKQTLGVLELQLSDNQLHVSIDSDDPIAIAKIVETINKLDNSLSLTLGDFSVENLSCNGCASSAEKLLNNQPGVVTASVQFQNKSAKIYYLQNKTTPLKLKVALQQLGYEMGTNSRV